MSKLLNLQPIKSKLNGLVCVECFDNDKLKLLLGSNLLLQNDEFNEVAQLKRYKKNKGQVQYQRNADFGRVFAVNGCGLQFIRKEIRHTLAGDEYVDIDIVNCQPTILNQVLLIHNYKQFKHLNDYVHNRPAYLKEIQDTYNVDKDNANILINMIIFDGSFATWRDSNDIQTRHKLPIIKELQREIKQMSAIVSEMNPLIAAKEKRNN